VKISPDSAELTSSTPLPAPGNHLFIRRRTSSRYNMDGAHGQVVVQIPYENQEYKISRPSARLFVHLYGSVRAVLEFCGSGGQVPTGNGWPARPRTLLPVIAALPAYVDACYLGLGGADASTS